MPFLLFEHYKSVMLQVPGATDAFMRGFLHITPLTVSVPLCGGRVYSDITGGVVPTKS